MGKTAIRIGFVLALIALTPACTDQTPVGVEGTSLDASVAGSCTSGPDYALVDLGTLPGYLGGLARAVNDEGRIVGWASAVGAIPDRAFLWESGSMEDLGTLGGASSRAFDVNNRGQIVGEAETAGGLLRAVLWEDGVAIDLGTLGGVRSYARGVNDRGDIVGAAETPSGETRAVLWSQGSIIDLGHPAEGVWSDAQRLNNRHTIVGSWENAVFTQQGAIWQGGEFEDMGSLIPRDVNERDQIVGGGAGPFLLDNGALTTLECQSGFRCSAIAINDRTQIVGWGIRADAVLWDHGHVHELPPFPGEDGNTRAWDINNCGAIVGSLSHEPGRILLWQDVDGGRVPACAS
jgi:probable HAF family extracellular repeat protein